MLSCNNSDDNDNQENFNAIVLTQGLDCGDSYLIQFNDNAENVPSNTTDNIFYEINLPEDYRVNNLEINVTFRLPNENELMNCTSQDDAYPQIYIESVN